jgi:CBS domain-containing protein
MANPVPVNPRATTGATPLYAASIVAIDTETTGLDPANARIVEISAVRLSAGALEPEPPLISRVRPDIAIPPRSTSFHHITDDMVAGSPSFAAVLPRLESALHGRLVIGHAVGFDLAVLAAEARRAGRPWAKPRSLDVRTLGMIVSPDLASHSLDGLAAWLGVEIVNRHSALGDAEAAARIFLALLPPLEARGIITVAQAERASRQQAGAREMPMPEGWVDPVEEAGQPVSTLSRADTFAFRHTVRDVMPNAVHIVPDDAPLRQAMQTMVTHNVSSVLVAAVAAPDQPVAAYGILTERDILRRVTDDGPPVLDRPAGALASRPLHTIRADAFVYRGVGRLARLGVRHLGVRSDAGSLVGVVAARDFLRSQTGPAVVLDDAIEAARTGRDLAAAWSTLPAVVAALLAEGIDSRLVARIISEELRAMTQRACVIAEDAMRADGRGGPPARYAVLVLGSGGRGESLLAPDQDNAVVFESDGDDREIDAWFAEHAVRFTDLLDAAGIPLCKGGVMARHAQWRGSAEAWTARVVHWIENARPEDLLNVDIFFDMMPVHGDVALGHQLFETAYSLATKNGAFAKLMGDGIPASEPFTMLGNLRLEDGRIDLKRHGLFPIVALARTIAIRHGLALRATTDRLEAIARRGRSAVSLDALNRAHQTLVGALLRQQARDLERGLPPVNKLDPSWLTKDELRPIRDALREAGNAPDLARDLMFE